MCLEVNAGPSRVCGPSDVQHYTALATYLTLTSNAVNTVIAEAGYRDQIKATEEMIRLLKDQVRITETQVKAGTVPYSNLLSVQSQPGCY